MSNTTTPAIEKPWLWKKGGPSPNPAGRTKAHQAVIKLREAASEEIVGLLYKTGKLSVEEILIRSKDRKISADEAMICSVRIKAINGDINAIKVIWERLLGKPLQPIEVEGMEGLGVRTGFEDWSTEEMLKMLPKIQEALEKSISITAKSETESE